MAWWFTGYLLFVSLIPSPITVFWDQLPINTFCTRILISGLAFGGTQAQTGVDYMFLQNPTSPLVTIASLFPGSPEISPFTWSEIHYFHPVVAKSLTAAKKQSPIMQRQLIKCSVNSSSCVCILKGILGERTQRSEWMSSCEISDSVPPEWRRLFWARLLISFASDFATPWTIWEKKADELVTP